MNKYVVEKMRRCEYKYFLLNQRYLRHFMNRIQSKNHTWGTYEINRISLSCFGDKMYTISNRYNGLGLGQ